MAGLVTPRCPTTASGSAWYFSARPSRNARRAIWLFYSRSRDLALLDARTWEEYRGSRVLAQRGGHIPAAVHLNWLDTIDGGRQLRLKTDHELTVMLSQRGIAPDREIVVYCHTHHRSAHSWMMLRHLGYSRVRGYAGSWSEWGNDARTPIE